MSVPVLLAMTLKITHKIRFQKLHGILSRSVANKIKHKNEERKALGVKLVTMTELGRSRCSNDWASCYAMEKTDLQNETGVCWQKQEIKDSEVSTYVCDFFQHYV